MDRWKVGTIRGRTASILGAALLSVFPSFHLSAQDTVPPGYGTLKRDDIVVRFTTECPFIYVENLGEMIRRHIEEEADLTVCENLPDGAYGEVISLGALRRSHQEGEDRHRTAWVSLYIFENPGKFKILRLLPPEPLRRPDLRITVDYPEDLVVCRKIYEALGSEGKRIAVESIIKFLDANPEVKAVNVWIKAGAGRIWS